MSDNLKLKGSGNQKLRFTQHKSSGWRAGCVILGSC